MANLVYHSDEIKEGETNQWYCKSNKGYVQYPADISSQIDEAPLDKAIQFTIKDNKREYQYELIRVNKVCAWQRNIMSNRSRPVICNYDDIKVKDDVEILNQKDFRNPFAASKAHQSEFMDRVYQRFGEMLPGDAYTGGEYQWLHCQHMSDDKIVNILKETAKSISLIDELRDKGNDEIEKQWSDRLKEMQNIDPLSKEWFIKMIKLYTYEGGEFYFVLNWNLRANEWHNVQKILAPVVFALKCVLEGFCHRQFDDKTFAPYHGKVHRIFNYTEEICKQILDFRVGDRIYFGGFTSTTKNKKKIETIAMSRNIEFDYSITGVYLTIDINGEHNCAVDISDVSEAENEEEVLISCFTRYKVEAIKHDANSKYMEVHLSTLPPKYETWNKWESERKVREELASLAYQYQFDDAMKLIKKNLRMIPQLVNSTRPDSSKFWTLGHQIAHSDSQQTDKWLDTLRKCGFWDGARDNLGRTIYDLGVTKSKQISSAVKTSDVSGTDGQPSIPKRIQKAAASNKNSAVTWVCPKCQQHNDKTHKYCSSCGYHNEWKCGGCKQTNKKSQRYCPNCGKDSQASGCIVM